MTRGVNQFAFMAALAANFLNSGGSLAEEVVVLRVFEWEGYLSPFAAEFAQFAKTRSGLDVRLDFLKDQDGNPRWISSAEDIFQAVRAGECDVVTPTHNYYKDSNSRLLKSLAPIELSQISHFQDITANLKAADYAKDGDQVYAVPLLGGGYSLAYNVDRVVSPPSSWQVLFDPRYRGRVSVTDTQYEANVYVAAILTGTPPANIYDWDSIDHAKVGALLARLAGNVSVYWDTNPDIELMADQLDLITDYGFGVAFANQRGQSWRFAETAEPTTVWIDNISLTNSALADPLRARAAHLLIDYMISPEIQARLALLYGVIVPNPKALDEVPADLRSTVRIGTDAVYRPELLWRPLDRRTRNGFRTLWNEAVEATKPSAP